MKKKWYMIGIAIIVVFSMGIMRVYFFQKDIRNPSSFSEGKEGIVLTISKIEEEENGYWIEYFVENKTEEPVSYAQDWKIECWQEGAWKQVAEAEGWEDCLYSASAQGIDTQRFYLKKDIEFSSDKTYRLVKKLYFLEEGEKDWMAGEFQFP